MIYLAGTSRVLLVATAAISLGSCGPDVSDHNISTDTMKVHSTDTIEVAVPGLTETIWLARRVRFCTVLNGPAADKVADLLDARVPPAGIRRDSQARAQAEADRPRSLQQRLGAILRNARWPAGAIIRVGFINGDPALQDRVFTAASTWSRYANIDFRRVTSLSDADVRVRFTDDDNSWSMLGTDALTVTTPDSQTVQFGWLTPTSTDRDVEEVVLHEFGHVLGLIHEHQQPNSAGIPWNRNKVYAYYWRSYGWAPGEVDDQVFSLYPATQTQYSQLDRLSIMMYAIPAELTDGRFVVEWNSSLSDTDKAFVRTTYPGR